MKLIKINTDHFVVVDDSEIQIGDWVYSIRGKIGQFGNFENSYSNECKKITHSTEPLNDIEFKRVKTLSLNEIKELIGEVDIDEKSNKYSVKKPLMYQDAMSHAYKDGYIQCIEDNKEKLYTKEDMINAFREGTNAGALHERLIDYDNGEYEDAEQYYDSYEESFIRSLQPKTEWEVEFIDGKLKLK